MKNLILKYICALIFWLIITKIYSQNINKQSNKGEYTSIEEALKEFDGDYDIDELRLMRIKFISEVAN